LLVFISRPYILLLSYNPARLKSFDLIGWAQKLYMTEQIKERQALIFRNMIFNRYKKQYHQTYTQYFNKEQI